jgi:peptidoglycan hydrolase CwlO-like protein
LAKSQETQKRFSNEVSYLTNKVDDLSSALLKSKMKIGELEATNESLTMRLNEISQNSLAEEIRQRVNEHQPLISAFVMCSHV